jgi:hypothetical protein
MNPKYLYINAAYLAFFFARGGGMRAFYNTHLLHKVRPKKKTSVL